MKKCCCLILAFVMVVSICACNQPSLLNPETSGTEQTTPVETTQATTEATEPTDVATEPTEAVTEPTEAVTEPSYPPTDGEIDAAVFILLGQSNAVGHSLQMNAEDEIKTPLKNVYGLHRDYNQKLDLEELKARGLKVGKETYLYSVGTIDHNRSVS